MFDRKFTLKYFAGIVVLLAILILLALSGGVSYETPLTPFIGGNDEDHNNNRRQN